MIDKNKTYVTRRGDAVRLYCTDDGGGSHPVHGAVNIEGIWACMSWPKDGESSGYYSLVEVKPKRTLDTWLNVYSDTVDGPIIGVGHRLRSAADAAGALVGSRIACLRITQEFTEGEGM